MPTITDKFNKAADGNGSYPVLGKVSTTRAAGETVLACEDLTGWATDTPVHFTTYRLTQDGKVDTTSQTDWKGIVSGNTITNLTRIAGAADTGSVIGDIVELNPTIGWLDDVITGLLVSHTQTGALKDGIVGTGKLANSAVTTAKIADLNVSTAKLANSAVTSAKIADGTIVAADLASNAVTTAKIASAAVTSDKMNITRHLKFANSFSYSTAFASKVEFSSVPAGTYLFLGYLTVGNLSSSYVAGEFWNATAGSRIGHVFQTAANASNTSQVTGFEIATLSAASKIQLRGHTGAALGASEYNRANLALIRLA